MRRSTVLTALFAVIALAVVAAPGVAAAEVTRTLKADLAPGSGSWFVENLAGTMKIVPGTGSGVVAVATIHAESDTVAALISIEQVDGGKTGPGLRVKYPVDTHTMYRYPRGSDGKTNGWLNWIGSGKTNLKYDGAHVTVSSNEGLLLYVDIEVQVPAKTASGALRNHVGNITAKGIEGGFSFESGSGDVALDKVSGMIGVETGSGDVEARDGGGVLSVETGSGDVNVERFSGESIACEVGSGDVTVRSGSARRLTVETGSGDVEAIAMDVEEFSSETGSGDVLLEDAGARLAKVVTEAGSGDIILRLGSNASFQVNADQGSGDLVNRFSDAQAIVRGREVIGYKRGDARIQIDASTGSGDVTVEPGGRASV